MRKSLATGFASMSSLATDNAYPFSHGFEPFELANHRLPAQARGMLAACGASMPVQGWLRTLP